MSEIFESIIALVIVGAVLAGHIDEGAGWRCHMLSGDMYQCECWLRKGRFEEGISGYDISKRSKEQLEGLKGLKL